MKISGKTKLVGVIGHPVSHSVSPQMHNAAFAALGLGWCYVPLPVNPVSPARVGEAVRGLRALGFVGSNVTVPHKQTVIAHLDQLTQAAAAIGAVNTIAVHEDGSLLGDNTDARGFIMDVRSYGMTLDGKSALVLGAGGSARAVVYGLAEAGCRSIMIVNRTVEKAQALADTMQSFFDDCQIRAAGTASLAEHSPQADLVVNCTSLGMTPNVETTPWDEEISFRSEQVVYDLVYNPPQTRLLQHAANHDAQAINGLGMLVWQGALSFERWTGQMPNVDVMREAVELSFTK